MNVTCIDGFILYAGTNTVTDKLRSIGATGSAVSVICLRRQEPRNDFKIIIPYGKTMKRPINDKKKAINNKTIGSAVSTRF